MACRVRRACDAWSASVREIYRGNAKQRELRGVAYNGSDGSRVWAYYETVYMAREDGSACRSVQSAGSGCK